MRKRSTSPLAIKRRENKWYNGLVLERGKKFADEVVMERDKIRKEFNTFIFGNNKK